MNKLAYLQNTSSPYVIVAITYLLYVAIFAIYHDRVGDVIASLAVIPVIGGSWYFGVRGGLLIAILSFVTNQFFHISSEHSYIAFLITPTTIIGIFVLLLVAVVIGRLGTLTRERRDAFIRLEKQVNQLTVLHEVALVSTQVETIDRLIERVTEIIGKNLFPDNFGILLMDEQKGVLHPHPSYRFISAKDLIPTDIPLGQGITGQFAQMGQPIRIGNVGGI